MLRWDSFWIKCIKYVTAAQKQACFPEHACNNSCCGRFQVSFLHQSSNLIACNNYVWMVFQSNFYVLCVVCLQRLNEGNSRSLQFTNAMREMANNVHPLVPSIVHHLDIPRMRIVTSSVRIMGSFLDGFTTRTKYLNHCVKLSFWIHPALRQAANEPGGGLSRSSSLHVAPRKHQKRRNIRNGSSHADNNCREWTPLWWRHREPSLTLKGDNCIFYAERHWDPFLHS